MWNSLRRCSTGDDPDERCPFHPCPSGGALPGGGVPGGGLAGGALGASPLPLARAFSWPLLEPGPRAGESPTGGGCGGAAPGAGQAPAGPPLAPAPARRLLWRHYYPEGGWGWVVVCCCTAVHVLNAGLQLSVGVLLVTTSRRFEVSIIYSGTFGPDAARRAVEGRVAEDPIVAVFRSKSVEKGFPSFPAVTDFDLY